jgi:hypothetical protein
MTTLYSSLSELETELRQLFYSLTPRSRASHRFSTSRQLEDGVDWKDAEHTPRTFCLEWLPTARPLSMGSAHYYAMCNAIINVWYPSRGWTLDMLSDAEHIRDAIKGIAGSGGGASTATNVSYRLVDPESGATVEDTEDGRWLVIPLVVFVTVEQS